MYYLIVILCLEEKFELEQSDRQESETLV